MPLIRVSFHFGRLFILLHCAALELCFVEFRINAACLDQVFVLTALHNPPVLHDEDLIRRCI